MLSSIPAIFFDVNKIIIKCQNVGKIVNVTFQNIHHFHNIHYLIYLKDI